MYDVDHIGLVVKDADRSCDFYCSGLSCEVVDRYEDERVKIAFLKSGSGVFEIIQYFNSDGTERGAGVVDHIAFKTENVEESSTRIKEFGAKLLFDAPKLVLGGRKKIMFFEGPDGERLEFIEDVK